MDLASLREEQYKNLAKDNTTISYVESCIQHVGFDRCFDSLKDFCFVEDENFHIHLINYINAKKQLREYVLCCAQQERTDTKLGLPLYKRHDKKDFDNDQSSGNSSDNSSTISY
jgi:hypothetical protein